MKNYVGMLGILFFMAIGCNKWEEKKNELKTEMIEKAIETASGQEIDALDISHVEENAAVVDIQIGDENIQNQFTNGFGSITASKETIAITIAGGENRQDNILMGFTGKDLTTLRPISGKMVVGENDGFTFSKTFIKDNSMEIQMSFEAEGEITQLQKDKVVIKVKGKIGAAMDVEKPENWKDYEGTITLHHPVFQALGSSKEDFIY